tara:strand:+ start:3714 stop:4634 length:921 start_codon:yes stop_codon:yes gene_type:complete
MSDKNSNPEAIGMQGDSIEEAVQPSVDNGSVNSFFNGLENQVNGNIQDSPSEVTPQDVGPNMASPEATRYTSRSGSNNEAQLNNGTDWEKRYKDSSREAVRLREQMNQLKPFVPVLDAMKKDSGLVDHVRDYLQSGGKPSKTLKERLNLDDDFVFDPQDAMENPESDSGRLYQAHIDSAVGQRVSGILQREKVAAAKARQAQGMRAQEEAFKKKHNLTDEQFREFTQRAQQHVMTLDDINYILNRDQASANTRNATKQDMLNQMKNVRTIPTSASGANSQSLPANPDNDIFDGLVGMDNDVDNLFG